MSVRRCGSSTFIATLSTKRTVGGSGRRIRTPVKRQVSGGRSEVLTLPQKWEANDRSRLGRLVLGLVHRASGEASHHIKSTLSIMTRTHRRDGSSSG